MLKVKQSDASRSMSIALDRIGRTRYNSQLTAYSRNHHKLVTIMGQFASSAYFYMYGKTNFTKTGYEKSKKKYELPDILAEGSDLKLTGHVYMVTGANTGIILQL